jgi:hypothetical protein
MPPLATTGALLGWGWFYAYGLLSSRTIKQFYGLDNNANPRQDLNKYAEVSIKEGKVTRAQVEQIQRFESASANSVEGYTFIFGSGKVLSTIGLHIANGMQYCLLYTQAYQCRL